MAGLIRFAMEFNHPDGTVGVAVMTGHVNITGASTPTDGDVDEVCDVLKDWWETGSDGEVALKSLVAATTRCTQVFAQKVQPVPAAAVRSLSVNSVGTRAGSALPPQAAVVLSLRTALAGRSYRGRMYLPGISESDSDQYGLLVGSYQQALADSTDGMRRQMETVSVTNGELCVYSRALDHKEKVTSIRVGNRVDIQRRRKLAEVSYVVGT